MVEDIILPVTLNSTVLSNVTRLKYLGQVLTVIYGDDDDLERQRQTKAMKSNLLARRFAHFAVQVKITLFRAYCQTFYTNQLWYHCTTELLMDSEYSITICAVITWHVCRE